MRLVRKGSRDSGNATDVRTLQERLNHFGFHCGKPDGIFGSNTEDAVELFQASRGLGMDGIVGSGTWKALLSESSDETPATAVQSWSETALEWLNSAEFRSQFPAEHYSEKAYAVLVAACEQYGKKEVPKGSNGGPEIAHIVDPGGDGKVPSAYCKYYQWADLSKMPPWCALFVSWSVREGLSRIAGRQISWEETPFGNWFGSVGYHYEPWGRENRTFVTAQQPDQVVPGMVFTMGRGGSGSDISTSVKSGHVGLVLKNNGDGTFETIEGNVSDKVTSYTRKMTDIRMFIWWWK